MFWRPRTVQARLIALLAATLVVIAGAGAIVAVVITDRDHRVDVLQHDGELSRSINAFASAVADESTATRATLPAALSMTDSRLAEVTTAGDKAMLSSALTDWRTARAGAAYDTLRSVIRSTRTAADARADRSEKLLRQAVDRVTYAVIGAFGLIILAVLLAVVRLRAWTTLPLRGLQRSVRNLTDGDLTQEVSAEGPADFVDLGKEVETLRQTLFNQRERSVQAEEALAQAPPVLESLRRQLVPAQRSTSHPGLRVGFASRPAEGVVAGDWCEIIELDGGLVGLVVGDVSGHGVDPGLVALQTKLLVTAALHRGLDPAHCVSWTQDQLNINDDIVVTAWIGILNPRTRSLRYTNAGHPTGWHRRPDGRVEPLISNGTLISTLGGRWSTEETILEPGSLLLLLTDGILEARSSTGAEFEDAGVLHTLALATEAGAVVPADIAEEVVLAARRHCAGRLADDSTVVAVALDV